MIAICDALSPRYRDMKALAGALVGALAIEFRARGWTGSVILDAEYFEETPPRLLIVAGPGHETLSVEAVSRFLKEKRRAGAGKAGS